MTRARTHTRIIFEMFRMTWNVLSINKLDILTILKFWRARTRREWRAARTWVSRILDNNIKFFLLWISFHNDAWFWRYYWSWNFTKWRLDDVTDEWSHWNSIETQFHIMDNMLWKIEYYGQCHCRDIEFTKMYRKKQ